jgi:Uncharacterised nucleotidyltransferase
MMPPVDPTLLGISSLEEDDVSLNAAKALLATDDPGQELDRLYPLLLRDKTLLGAMAHLERAGARLDELTLSAKVYDREWPLYALLPPPQCPSGRLSLESLHRALDTHRSIMRDLVCDLANAHGPRVVLLFGRAFEVAYPEQRYRLDHDVDLFASDLDAGRQTAEILRRFGFHLIRCNVAELGGRWVGQLALIRRDRRGFLTHVDAICGGRPPDRGLLPAWEHPALCARARSIETSGTTVWVAAPEDMLLATAEKTIRKDPFPANGARDVRLILCAEEGRLDWDYLRHAAKRQGLTGALHRLLTMKDRVFGDGTVPPEVLRQLVPARLERRVLIQLDAPSSPRVSEPERAAEPTRRWPVRLWRALWFLRLARTGSAGSLAGNQIRGLVFRTDLRLIHRAPTYPGSARRVMTRLRRGYGSLCEVRAEPAPREVGFCLSRRPSPDPPDDWMRPDALERLRRLAACLPQPGERGPIPSHGRRERRGQAHRCGWLTYGIDSARR